MWQVLRARLMLLEAQGMEGGHHRGCLPSVLPDFGVSAVHAVKKDVASLQVEGGGLHGGD